MMGIIVLRFFAILLCSLPPSEQHGAPSQSTWHLLTDGALSRYSWALHAFFVTGGDVFLYQNRLHFNQYPSFFSPFAPLLSSRLLSIVPYPVHPNKRWDLSILLPAPREGDPYGAVVPPRT